MELIARGGPIMLLILGCSVVVVAVVAERLWYLWTIQSATDVLLDEVTEAVRRNRIVEALEVCERTPVPLAQVLKAGIIRHDQPPSEIRAGIEEAAQREIPKLERRLGVLATVAHIAPLLGLLGTVLGMVAAFRAIEVKASALAPVTPGDLAGGIWQALLTTVAGLAVAIPTFVAYNFLVSLVGQLVRNMECSASDLVTALSERRALYVIQETR